MDFILIKRKRDLIKILQILDIPNWERTIEQKNIWDMAKVKYCQFYRDLVKGRTYEKCSFYDNDIIRIENQLIIDFIPYWENKIIKEDIIKEFNIFRKITYLRKENEEYRKSNILDIERKRKVRIQKVKREYIIKNFVKKYKSLSDIELLKLFRKVRSCYYGYHEEYDYEKLVAVKQELDMRGHIERKNTTDGSSVNDKTRNKWLLKNKLKMKKQSKPKRRNRKGSYLN
jgi:hypothetical protein